MNNDEIGMDLKLKFDRLGADLTVLKGDLDTVFAEFNLAQAIIHRLRTEEGELHDIGHSDYGSRLYSLIGEPNTERTRERAKSLVQFCLSMEPRIKEITSINILTNPVDPNSLDIEVDVLPVKSSSAINVVYPFNLEGV
jgi:phage baseplate assembly protein W